MIVPTNGHQRQAEVGWAIQRSLPAFAAVYLWAGQFIQKHL